MSSAVSGTESAECTADWRLLDDLFHALSQPLTTLRCGLAVSLQKPRTTARYRRDLQVALQQAESVAHFAAGIREVVQAGVPDQDQLASDLSQCLREVGSHLQPVAESSKVRLHVSSGSDCPVKLEAGRLRQALFRLMEFALQSSRAGSQIRVNVTRENPEAVLTMFIVPQEQRNPPGRPRSQDGAELGRRLIYAIARRIFETAGGHLRIRRGPKRMTLTVRLPLSVQEPALPLA